MAQNVREETGEINNCNLKKKALKNMDCFIQS